MVLRWFLSGVVGVLVTLPVQAGQLTYWRFNHDQQRLDLTTDGGVQPRAMLLADPPRLVIDLPNTNLGKRLPRAQDGKAKIEELRAGQFNPYTTRIVIELDEKYTLLPTEVRVRGLTPNRWFVQLPPPVRSEEERDRPTPPPIAITVPPPIRTQEAIALPPPRRGLTIVIDPGHGGPDPGAIGINGLQEKRIVLSISEKVAAVLRAKGVNAVLTRTDDRDLGLAPRVALAERVKARVFVSIHANAISLSYPQVNGLETYYYNTGGSLARTIHKQVLQSVNVRDRGVRRARFYVLRHTSMPATLVEVGFVTGREDGRKLATPEYQQQMAEAIAMGILRYLKLQ